MAELRERERPKSEAANRISPRVSRGQRILCLRKGDLLPAYTYTSPFREYSAYSGKPLSPPAKTLRCGWFVWMAATSLWSIRCSSNAQPMKMQMEMRNNEPAKMRASIFELFIHCEPWATPAPVPWFQDLKSRTGGIRCQLRSREYSSIPAVCLPNPFGFCTSNST